MKKNDYLSLVMGADTEIELVGIRNAADTDPDLLPLEYDEVDKAIGKKAAHLREESADRR